MEIFPYMLSVLLTALVIRWSRVNAAAKPGTKVPGLFRYRDNLIGPAGPPPKSRPFAATAAGR
jgi:hypothetical protein